ncbi:MAG: hypothetical protein BGN92_14000 [Sphingobacteriales bacterium 41-5]|nr:MAG: hypothetical protein ABS67_02895 [Niabella sp. SCN 42-15]OJU26320.1 MAG: hypothetical protein BGN92_14000 [Sphingobacteriales bacterium 41-5]
MIKKISREDFLKAEAKMENILATATKKGGFEFLTEKESKELDMQSQIVKKYEDENIVIPMPDTIKGLIQLKMYEKQLKQKELAKMLNTSDTQLSEILHEKRKPSVALLKSLHQVLGIDAELLLRAV